MFFKHCLWIYRRLIARPENNFAALDGLRAIAVLLIIIFHCGVYVRFVFPNWSAALPHWAGWLIINNWMGVDIFFVLSGFLIGRMLFFQLRTGKISFKSFYIRRTFRIFPAYYLVLTISLFVFARLDTYRFFYENAPWEVLLKRSWANYLYISNYLYGNTVSNALKWGWSLCIEEHFYLLLPVFLSLLFRFFNSWGRVVALVCVILMPLFSRCVIFLCEPKNEMFNNIYAASHTRFDGLLFGVFLAYGYVYHHETMKKMILRIGKFTWIAAICCFISIFKWGGLSNPEFFSVVLQFLMSTIGTSLLLINGLFLNNFITLFLASPIWYPFARVSYGIYLIHPILLFWVLQWWPHVLFSSKGGAVVSFWGFTMVSIILSTVSAALLFLILEHPLLEWGVRISRYYMPTLRSNQANSLTAPLKTK